MSTYVGPVGPRDAKIALVGEAPGAEEERQGKPFAGSSGSLLNDMLARAGIDRKECYITNVVKVRPPRNNFALAYYEKNQPTPALEKAWEDLRQELLSVKPNVTVLLGNEPLKAVAGKSGIHDWRGSIIQTPVGKAVPTLHPASLLREYKFRGVVEADLRRALAQSAYPDIRRPDRTFIIDPTLDEVIEVLTKVKKEKLTVTFDVETVHQEGSLSLTLRCLGLAWSPYSAICIPFLSNRNTPTRAGRVTGDDNRHWSNEALDVIVGLLKDILTDPSIGKVAQNFPFDNGVIKDNLGFEVKGLVMDTMVAAHCVNSELPKSLDFLTSIFTEIPRYSDYDCGSDYETWRYNCWDCVATFEVFEALKGDLKELKVEQFYHQFAQPVMLSLAKVSRAGVLIDLDERERQEKEVCRQLEETAQRLEDLAGRPLNPNSSKQMREFLYEELKLRPKHRLSGSVTCDEKALIALMSQYPVYRDLLQACLDYRGLVKLKTTYFKPEVIAPDGRFYTNYNATGTTTGRLSSSTPIHGFGGNLQNIPRGPFRKMFAAPPGHVWLKADLSQAEARAVAWFAKIDRLIERFLDDPSFDIHVWNASLVWDIPEDKVTKELRSKVKPRVHGANYGISARGSSLITGVPYKEAAIALRRYHEALPELKQWWRKIESEVTRTRQLRTPLGRLRRFLDRLGPALFRSAYAFLPQSHVGDIINWAFHRLDILLPEGARPVLQVHDEIDVICREDQVDDVISLMAREMVRPVQIEGVKAPLVIPVDISVGPNWYDVKEVKL